MEDLSILGNAAAVPFVVAITQVLKKNLQWDFEHGSNLLALVVALVFCTGWEIYNLDAAALDVIAMGGFLGKFRYGVDLVITSFGTWLSASKIYDLSYGHKRRHSAIEQEKDELRGEISKLKESQGDVDEDVDDDPEVSAKLRKILEGE